MLPQEKIKKGGVTKINKHRSTSSTTNMKGLTE
jgi:hypothetical protein